MKRISLSILFSAIAIIVYAITAGAITGIFDIREEVIRPFAIPVRLPSYLYYEVLHQKDSDNELINVLFVCAAILFNIILYAPIFYLILTVFSKTKTKTQVSEFPPDPPTFD